MFFPPPFFTRGPITKCDKTVDLYPCIDSVAISIWSFFFIKIFNVVLFVQGAIFFIRSKKKTRRLAAVHRIYIHVPNESFGISEMAQNPASLSCSLLDIPIGLGLKHGLMVTFADKGSQMQFLLVFFQATHHLQTLIKLLHIGHRHYPLETLNKHCGL